MTTARIGRFCQGYPYAAPMQAEKTRAKSHLQEIWRRRAILWNHRQNQHLKHVSRQYVEKAPPIECATFLAFGEIAKIGNRLYLGKRIVINPKKHKKDS